MRNFKDLEIWNLSRKLAVEVYQITRSFPKEELFGITSQIRRAVVSVGANITEGCGRKTNTELIRFVTIGLGSLYEVEYLLILSKDLAYIDKSQLDEVCSNILTLKIKMSSFMKKLKEISE